MGDQEQGVASAQERRPQPGTALSANPSDRTPGPWVVVCRNPRATNPHMGWWDVETPSGRVVAASLSLADAHAVASMPDLLEALKAVRTAFSVAHIALGVPLAGSESLRLAEAAISKATQTPGGNSLNAFTPL